MTNPVTNVEIEDVLSSIRRLVSDEARTERAAPEPAEGPSQPLQSDYGQKPVETPALVLTPALRVLDGALAEPEPLRVEEDEQPAETGDAPAAQEMTSEAATLLLTEDLVAQDIETEKVSDDTAEPENVQAGDQLPSFLTHRTVHEGTAEQSEAVEPEHEGDQGETAKSAHELGSPDAASETQIQDMIQGEAYAERIEVAAKSVEVDAESAASELQASAESSAALEEPQEAGDSLEVEQNAQEQHSESAVSEPQPESETQADPSAHEAEAETDAQPELTIEAKIAALEALIGTADSQFEPDGSSGASSAMNESLPWQDSDVERSAAGLRAVPDPAEESQAAEFHSEFDAFEQARLSAIAEAADAVQADVADTLLETQDAIPVLDEEALRDMVADIVRQELQGPLGERITRNVRKLVRREIYRAMAANELD